MNRILVWHDNGITNSNTPYGATFYMERDYTPVKLRLYARKAPVSDMEVDIQDDDVSIMADRASTYVAYKKEYSIITYGTPTGTFVVGETVSGGTSGATGTIVSYSLGIMKLDNMSAASFVAGEVVSGATATLTSHSFVRGGNPATTSQDSTNQSTILASGSNLNEMADDFLSGVPILEEGSLITCRIKIASGAQDITIQLELESADEEDEEAD